MPNSPTSLERLFHSNVRMSPSRSRKPIHMLRGHRAALNRAAHAFAELKKAEKLQAQLAKNIPKLRAEYQKLVRRIPQRMYTLQNANLRRGPLTARELQNAHTVARVVRHMSATERATRHWGLPFNLRERVVRTPLLH